MSDSTPEIHLEIHALFFPDEGPISVEIYVYIDTHHKPPKIRAIMDSVTPEFREMGADECVIRSSWTVPTSEQMDRYREESSRPNESSTSLMVNSLALRDTIVINHLKSLTLPPDDTPFDLHLNRHNRLNMDTLQRLKKLHAGLYDILYSKYISDACLMI